MSTAALLQGADAQEDAHDVVQQSRPWYRGNCNLWLLLGSAVSVYFTIILGGPWLLRAAAHKSPWVVAHVVLACVASWLCICNLFHTPSHGEEYRVLHRWIGRLFVGCGSIAMLTGFITVYIEWEELPRGMSVAISVGGAETLVGIAVAYWAIRRFQALTAAGKSADAHFYRELHMYVMVFVFFAGCLVPAMLRVPVVLGLDESDSWSTYATILPSVMGVLFVVAHKRQHFFV